MLLPIDAAIVKTLLPPGRVEKTVSSHNATIVI